MSDSKLTMFGKTYNTVGSTDSNFIIKTKGDLKIQWGNKFINLIKNGKIASDNKEFIRKVKSENDITEDGIYLTDEKEVWILGLGTKLNLSLLGDNTYLSFNNIQNLNFELKKLVLLNSGLYYNTIEDFKKDKILEGVVYILDLKKLYTINNGLLLEYLTNLLKNPELSSNIKLYTKDNNNYIDANNNLYLTLNNIKYLSLIKDIIEMDKSLSISNNNYIQSRGADESTGFRLYNNNEKSILEVDSIVWRNKNIDDPSSTESITNYDSYSSLNNIITNISLIGDTAELILKYKNNYKTGDTLLIPSSSDIIVSIAEVNNTIVATLKYSMLAPEDIKISLTLNNLSLKELIISKDLNSGTVDINDEQYIISKKIINSTLNIYFSDSKYRSVPTYKEFKVINSNEQTIIISGNLNEISYLALYGVNSKVLLKESNKLIFNLELKLSTDNLINTVIGTISKEYKELNLEEDLIGLYSNNMYAVNPNLYGAVFNNVYRGDSSITYPTYSESLKLPENLLNIEQYNKVVPSLEWVYAVLDSIIPKGTIIMYHGTEIPKGWAICNGENGTPNLIGKFIKATGDFQSVGENTTDLSKDNSFTITAEYLPKHSHPHTSHYHTYNIGTLEGTTSKSGVLSSSFENSNYLYNLSTSSEYIINSIESNNIPILNRAPNKEESKNTYIQISGKTIKTNPNASIQGGITSGGDHTHTISIDGGTQLLTSTLTSIESTLVDKDWPNKPIKLEPHAYSLVFIMKI